jgi:SAM-dependent methyltransferase
MYEGNLTHYLSVGQSAARCIKTAMMAGGNGTFRSVQRVLDFGCGYGRVLRAMKAMFPTAEFTACDILKDAVDFCSRTFGANAVVSSEHSSAIRLTGQYDLIWCGTLLTQFDAPQFKEFLSMFRSLLSPGGMLVFTTHGPYVANRLSAHRMDYGMSEESVASMLKGYETVGFGYADYPDHVPPQLGVSKYGVCISRPSWVCRQVEDIPNLRLVMYTEQAWDNHQDAVACINE